jgi:hypothetical protein
MTPSSVRKVCTASFRIAETPRAHAQAIYDHWLDEEIRQ